MRQFHSGKRRIQRFGHNLVVVDANHRDIFADNQPATGGLGVDGPSAGVVEAEEAGCKAIGGVGMLQQQGAVNYGQFVGKEMPLAEYQEFQKAQAK